MPEDEIERKNYYPGDYLIPVAKQFVIDKKAELEAVGNDVDKISLDVYCDYAKEYEEKVQRDLLDNFRVTFDKFYSDDNGRLFLKKKYGKCSSGQKKKFAIIKALVRKNAPLYIFDEPMNCLDIETMLAFIDEINNYINWYNTKRIKQSLGYMSPVEYRHSLGLAI